jgi:RNA polymerase sigma-70 factor (ECF subfamily)
VDTGQTASRFQTTSWTLVVQARSSREDLERLLGLYWSPVYAYLRRRGQRPQDAADLSQGFLIDVVLKRDLIGQADPERGRFRSFLLAALKNYVIDEHRREAGRDGERPTAFVPEDPAALEAAEPSEADDPTRAFDRQWAATILGVVLERLREACEREGLGGHWAVFEGRILRPVRHGCEPVPVEDLVRSVGAHDRDDIYSMQNSVKRKFRAVLREVVAETVDNPAELDAELAEVRNLLSV